MKPVLIARSSVLALLIATAGCAMNEEAAVPAAGTEAAAMEAVASPETPSAEDIAAESARLNEWFDQKFAETISRSPITQTYLGIKDNYGEWDDVSDANALKELEILRADVAEMETSFNPDLLDHQAKISWRIAEMNLKQAEEDYKYLHHGYVFDQMNGVQAEIPAFLINQHQITSKSDAEAYISRLNGVPAYLEQNLENARIALADGIQPPAFVYKYVLSDAQGVITGVPFDDSGKDSPLMGDFRKKVTGLVENGTITQAEADQLLDEATDALTNSVGPAYKAAIAELGEQAKTATTDDGAWKLPDGDAYYASRLTDYTTTDMTAEEIHNLGLAEVARIHDEMRGIMKQVGFEGSLKEFFDFTRTDPQFFKPNTPEGKAEYLDEATGWIDQMREDLPNVFNTFPKADMIVKAVEPFREKSAGKAFYSRPAPDGSRPGTYYANLYRMQDMPTYQMQALAFHEGIPGHHMQIAIAQELTGVPKFRKYGGFTAFSEGWGLYSEYLPKEMGYYSDPYDDFGRLAMEIWRAARLVVDTGIHDQHWTREQAIQYLLDNTPNPEGDARKAIERYIVMPGQATAYKIGMNKIVELREKAKAELGDKFDIRDFHDVVLKDGAVPLDILEENVDAWITETKAAE
ncbi:MULTISPECIES: DUF885 domain-containing protein [Hyphomonas]|uniref:DUF885 domain-containing protein n=1 Tax=Hyphomonas adhaerens TaxID=81029 RepID=A0A3B9GXG9_9PROT|nr:MULTISPECIES: DUF885 domain-containing protein [Hyphomonas]MBB39049.1 DUF885 domain-containing protein [Hyphomonas sp.]HAE27143.1 DUF885 domain-containing protein [Hyphomonas adhaerens]|tara:strand:+ start:3098 stop:5002 length:1905 start_codon:yes stop_codon:yes gene_type:complete